MKLIIMPNSEESIRLAQPEDDIVLMTTCSPNQIGQFLTARSGNSLPGNRPGSMQRQGTTLTLTSSSVRAYYDSIGKTIVLLSIKKRYLKKIPSSMNGWSCEPGAPMKLLQQQPGQTAWPIIKPR